MMPDPEVRERLANLAKLPKQRHARRVHPEDLHMTLAFLGMVHSYRIEHIEAIAENIRGRAFRLKLDHVGYWKRSRILWCAPAETPGELGYLEEDLWSALEEEGFARDHPNYQPHVTLLRKASALKDPVEFEPIEWNVSGFSLVWSQDGVDPPRYKVLNSWSLDPDDR